MIYFVFISVITNDLFSINSEKQQSQLFNVIPNLLLWKMMRINELNS